MSPVTAEPYLLRLQIDAQGKASEVTRIAAPRTLESADAIRTLSGDRLPIFESNAFGHDGPYGGAVVVAQVSGDRLTRLTPVVARLSDPSSGLVYGDRVYFVVEVRTTPRAPSRRRSNPTQCSLRRRITRAAQVSGSNAPALGLCCCLAGSGEPSTGP